MSRPKKPKYCKYCKKEIPKGTACKPCKKEHYVNRLPFVKLDENLKKIVGNLEYLQIGEMNKKIWKYIETNNLKINYKDYIKM